MSKYDHPTRKELIAASRSSGTTVEKHLPKCNWCDLYFELIKRYSFTGEVPLTSAPQSWIDKAVSIAVKTEKIQSLKSLVARIAFDSWAMPMPEGVRGETMIQERRLRFEVNDKSFDVRAEYRRNHWDFTARITDPQGQPIKGKLLAGKKELMADENGFYQWSSKKPPKGLELLIERDRIEIPELSWKKFRPE